jgi:hypothetical protein
MGELTSVDPEPGVGTVVKDDLGVRWERHGEGYWVHECCPSGEAESWCKIAGNYGPVTVVKPEP